MGQNTYFFKVPQVSRFMPLLGVISRLVEYPLKVTQHAA